MTLDKPRIVIIGGGFAGLNAAQALKNAHAEVIVLDKHNYHLFQPLLYQVATAGLSPADIASPIRGVLRKQKNARVILGQAMRIDREQRKVILNYGEIEYDYLIIATGMVNNYFGHKEWEETAPGLKTLEEALDIRRRMLLAFEAAEYTEDEEELRALMTFVIIGAGPTGVEMAGAIREVATEVMARDFRNVEASQARIILIEGQDRVLSAFSQESSKNALKALEGLGVEVMLKTFVEELTDEGVRAGGKFIATKTVLWAAGLKAEPLVNTLGSEQDRAGRVIITPTLTLPDDERVYVLGDVAHFKHGEDGMLPGLAPVAMQQGKHAASNIMRHIAQKSLEPFHYLDKGTMATIGRAAAVAETGKLRLKGFIAWLAWLFIHLLFLVGFRNKVSVLVNWMYSYVAYRRSTRLIVNVEQSVLGRALLDHAPRSMEGSAGLVMEPMGKEEQAAQRLLLGQPQDADEDAKKPAGRPVVVSE